MDDGQNDKPPIQIRDQSMESMQQDGSSKSKKRGPGRPKGSGSKDNVGPSWQEVHDKYSQKSPTPVPLARNVRRVAEIPTTISDINRYLKQRYASRKPPPEKPPKKNKNKDSKSKKRGKKKRGKKRKRNEMDIEHSDSEQIVTSTKRAKKRRKAADGNTIDICSDDEGI